MSTNWLLAPLIPATAFAFVLGCTHAPGPDQTTAALVEIVKTDKKYASWAKIQCVQFVVEQQDDKQTEIAMREKHGDG